MEKNIRKLFMIIGVIVFAIALRFALEFAFNAIWDFFEFGTLFGLLGRGFFVGIFALVWLSVTLRSESPNQKLPWLLILAFEPVVGTTLFLTFGRNFKNSRRYKKRPLMVGDRYITRETSPEKMEFAMYDIPERPREIFRAAHHISHHQPFINDARIDILPNGETFYPDLEEAIQKAEKFILLEFFIIRSDETGRRIMEMLIEKAEAGVDVKLILDGLGSARMKRSYLRRLKKSAIDLIINDPIYFPLFNTRINFRNHRKIVVVDGETAYTGGMNLGNEYDNRVASSYYFRDTQIKVRGTAIKSLTALFFKDYYYNTGEFIDTDFYYPHVTAGQKGVSQIIESGPDSDAAHIRNLYLKMILNAKRSIKIMTPYMALDQETLTALETASQSGVDVEIIIPGDPDKYLVYKVTKYFVTTLLGFDIKIYSYDRGFSHAKVLIIDDEMASVGSYNLDNRSAVIDFEVTALLYNDSVQTLVEHFEADKEDSSLIDPVEWARRPLPTRLVESVFSLFSPII